MSTRRCHEIRVRKRRPFLSRLEVLEARLQPSVDLVASADNTLVEDPTGNLSDGAGAHFYVGKTNKAANNTRRAVVEFDLSTIPAGSTINSATLTLHMSKTVAGAEMVALHRALQAWGEGTSDAALGGTGNGEGDGIQATTGDATWLFTDFNTQSWTTPGGDFVDAPSAAVSVAGIGSYQWTGLAADVQQWLNNPGTNFGWVVTGDETTKPTVKQFDARQNPTATNRPVLAVDFTPPATGTAPTFSNGPPPSGTVDIPYSFTYTATGSPAPSFNVTAGALPPGLMLGSASGAITGTPTAAGTFTGTVTATNSAGAVPQDFSIQVAPAATTVTLTAAGGTYTGNPFAASAEVAGPDGQAQATLDGVSPTISYFAGNTATGAPLAGAPTAAGTYTALAAFAGSANFNPSTSAPATFTIAPTALTVTADNQTLVQGSALPALTVHFNGFVNGEAAANLSTPATVTTTATSASAPGAYPITVSGATATNYAITFVGGTLTLTAAPVVTPPPTSGQNPPPPSGQYPAAPALTLTAPTKLQARGLVASLHRVALNHVPAGTLVAVRISTSVGKLNLVLKGLKVTGNNSGRLTFRGSQAAVTRALNAIALKFARPHSTAKVTVTVTSGQMSKTTVIRVS